MKRLFCCAEFVIQLKNTHPKDLQQITTNKELPEVHSSKSAAGLKLF